MRLILKVWRYSEQGGQSPKPNKSPKSGASDVNRLQGAWIVLYNGNSADIIL